MSGTFVLLSAKGIDLESEKSDLTLPLSRASPGGSASTRESACNVGRPGSVPALGRSLEQCVTNE